MSKFSQETTSERFFSLFSPLCFIQTPQQSPEIKKAKIITNSSKFWISSCEFILWLWQHQKDCSVPELFALHSAETLAVVVSAPWSSPARDQRAKSVGSEKTEIAEIGGHFCTMACEHKYHSASKKLITVKRF